MMIVTDEESVDGATETFNIKVPGDHPMYNRTWLHAGGMVGRMGI